MTDGWCGRCLYGQSGQPNYSSVNWPGKKGHCETVISQKWPLVVLTSSSCGPSIISRSRKESWPLTLSALFLLLSCSKLFFSFFFYKPSWNGCHLVTSKLKSAFNLRHYIDCIRLFRELLHYAGFNMLTAKTKRVHTYIDKHRRASRETRDKPRTPQVPVSLST